VTGIARASARFVSCIEGLFRRPADLDPAPVPAPKRAAARRHPAPPMPAAVALAAAPSTAAPRAGLSLAVLALLIAADWAWTLAHLARGIEEANPLLAAAFSAGGVLGFSAAKLGVSAAGLAVLVSFRDRWLARMAVRAGIACFVAVLAVHAATEIALRA
jgi:hypothetical protein